MSDKQQIGWLFEMRCDDISFWAAAQGQGKGWHDVPGEPGIILGFSLN